MSFEQEVKKQKAKNKRLQKEGKPQEVYSLMEKDYEKELENGYYGEKYTKCKKCGKEFEQDYVPDRNAYTDWQVCKECRNKIAEEKREKIQGEKQVSVATIPFQPYPWQQEAAEAFETHRFQVLSCGNRCFFDGTFINGAEQFVEDLDEARKCINENGEFQDIVQVQELPYIGDKYSIKCVGTLPVEVTANHSIYVYIFDKKTRIIKRETKVEAKDLYSLLEKLPDSERAYFKMPRVKANVKCDYWEFEKFDKNYKGAMDGIPLNEDTAWAIGLYCADGCNLGNGSCKWTLNYKDDKVFNRLKSILDTFGVRVGVRERPKEGTRCVWVSKQQMCWKFDKEIGHGSTNKRIPYSILYNENERILLAFLQGYYAGDGSFNKDIKVLRCTTVSKALALQLQFAWTRLGHFAKITTTQRERRRLKKDGTLGACNREYIVSLTEARAIRRLGYDLPHKEIYRCSSITHKDGIYTPIRKITVSKTESEVYAVTSENGKICANGTKIGNCGKDRYSIMTGIKYFVECLNENRHIDNPDMVPPVLWWQIAPTEPMARQNWRELKAYFPKEWIVACSDSAYRMETICGGVIEVRSGYDADSLVGVGLDLVTITEAARFKDLKKAWGNLEARLISEGRGRKKDRGNSKSGMGKAIINSSPLGKNDFYRLYCYGQPTHSDYSSDWWSKIYPWTANPTNAETAKQLKQTKYGWQTYEEILRRQKGEREYRSNWLGEFTLEQGSVFKSFEEKCVVNVFDTGMNLDKEGRKEYIDNWQRVEPTGDYIGGYDPATGSSGDSPAFVIRNRANNRVVRIYDLYGKDYEQQWDFIASICKTFNYAPIAWLRTGHTAVGGQFEKRGIAEIPIDEQGQNKAKLVQTLELAVENGDIQVLADGSPEAQTLIYQMNDYTEKNGKYSNNEQAHDDFVSALYAAFSDYSVEKAEVTYCGLMGGV